MRNRDLKTINVSRYNDNIRKGGCYRFYLGTMYKLYLRNCDSLGVSPMSREGFSLMGLAEVLKEQLLHRKAKLAEKQRKRNARIELKSLTDDCVSEA
jgi:hypothetical protein